MRKIKKLAMLLLTSGTVFFSFNGCAASNPFGIGYDRSVCEDASQLGFCGRPADIYKYQRLIKKVQEDYVKSGIGKQLYFAITDDGTVLVKDKRDGKWVPYFTSRWYKIIQARLRRQKEILQQMQRKNAANVYYSRYQRNRRVNLLPLAQNIPVTTANDLSVMYKKQGPILQTRTNVGNLIRDYGEIQKVWIAPYVDKKGNLVTAHEIFVVIRNPQWVVGEKYPKNLSTEQVGVIPTPISSEILKEQQKYNQFNDKVITYYNEGLQKDLEETLHHNPYKEQKTIEKNMNIIYDFLKKK